MAGDFAGILRQAYVNLAIQEFNEQQCKAGLQIIQDHIGEFLKTILPTSVADYIDMHILTGCRASKFSLHIVMKDIYCESSVLSMPLVVYKIAHSFIVQNMNWLVQNWQSASGTDELKFRLRVLMPLNMTHNDYELSDPMLREDEDVERPSLLFTGYNDSPFDEAIYSAHHILLCLMILHS